VPRWTDGLAEYGDSRFTTPEPWCADSIHGCWIEHLTSLPGPYYAEKVSESNTAARRRKAENAR
jgi:hypothetical protein